MVGSLMADRCGVTHLKRSMEPALMSVNPRCIWQSLEERRRIHRLTSTCGCGVFLQGTASQVQQTSWRHGGCSFLVTKRVRLWTCSNLLMSVVRFRRSDQGVVGGFTNFHGAVIEITPEDAEVSGCLCSDVFYVSLPLQVATDCDSQILGTVYHLKNMTM